MDQDVEQRALDARRQLARLGHHRLPPVDLLVAAVADRHDLAVLHYDGDYDVIADPVRVVLYDGAWPAIFAERSRALRAALGEVASRIDHIGSTAVPGLAAKPIVDIQISVAAFEPLGAFRAPLEGLGYVFRAGNQERTKRYFREPPGSRRTHIHVRRAGSFSEQLALLFRDFMRAHPDWAQRYAALKIALAERHASDRDRYTEEKRPFTWEALAQADEWAQRTGWSPGPSDA